MDKSFEPMYGYMPPYMNDMGMNMNMNFEQSNFDNNMFNPIMQYEQAYMYYRYLTQQLEYKIKCKEFEQLNRKYYQKS